MTLSPTFIVYFRSGNHPLIEGGTPGRLRSRRSSRKLRTFLTVFNPYHCSIVRYRSTVHYPVYSSESPLGMLGIINYLLFFTHQPILCQQKTQKFPCPYFLRRIVPERPLNRSTTSTPPRSSGTVPTLVLLSPWLKTACRSCSPTCGNGEKHWLASGRYASTC